MKKLLLLFISIFFVSCTSPLDKEVRIAEWAKTIELIKTITTEFTPEDYNSAGDALAKNAFGAMLENGKPATITYRQLLDQAKTERIDREKKLEEWNAEVVKLKNVFDLKVTSGKFINDGSEYYPDKYYFDVIISTGNKAISAIDGKIEFRNEVGDLLFTKYIKEALELEANQSEEAEIYALLDSDDNLVEAKVLPFEKMQTEWIPSLIILQDGSRITIPRKP